MNETPAISTASYTSSSPDIMWTSNLSVEEDDEVTRILGNMPDFAALHRAKQQNQTESITDMANTSRRVVQVFIADPNENVPLEHSVLFKGDQKLTDLTDTELFFEVPMAEILKSHNEKRVKFLDKEATKRAGKDVVLDAVKIRELKMVVVTVAQF